MANVPDSQSAGELVARFAIARGEFQRQAIADRDRLRDGWAALDAQRQRLAAERAESDAFFAKQDAALEARAAEVARREKAISGERAKMEKQTETLRREAVGLEARCQHARVIVEDLERQRQRLHAELLAPRPGQEPPGEMLVALDRAKDRDLTLWVAELDTQERALNHDRAALATVKAGLEREAADLGDRRRLLAEQLVMLAAARGQWQDAERRTIAEMEDLARGLRRREHDLDTREQRLIRAGARRREDGYELWQLRLRLESWHSKLAAYDVRRHAERADAESDLRLRARLLAHRESEIVDLFARWERVREQEREWLRAEIQLWADDRRQLVKAATEYDRRAGEAMTELTVHAARALASEELVAEAVADSGSTRAARRLDVLRKRWEQTFDRRAKEIAARRAEASADLARLDERYAELERLLVEVTQREEEANNRLARAAAADAFGTVPVAALATHGADGCAELAALRDEVERMADVLMRAELPEPPDPPDRELPWGADDAGAERPDVLPFNTALRAA